MIVTNPRAVPMIRWIFLPAGAGVCLALLAACGKGATPTVAPAPAAGSSARIVVAGPADSAAIARARADSARHPYTDADVRFMSGMIEHHAQAIVMAGWAPSHGASPTVRTLAERIVNAQQDEIATAQQWLADRRRPVPHPDTTAHRGAAGANAAAGHAGMRMVGMLSPAQLRELDAARGPEFDRRFLTFMIQHHQGAVKMVEELFGSYGAAQDEQVFKFASDVNVDQTTEIARMRRMLTALPAGS